MIYPPLFGHSVGFDRMQQLMNTENKWDSNAQTYPPYNIEKMDENAYRITIAVAGFSRKIFEHYSQRKHPLSNR